MSTKASPNSTLPTARPPHPQKFTPADVSRIIEMAWEDRTPFEAIHTLFGLKEQQVIQLMRRELKPSSFRLWRQRVSGRATKHRKRRHPAVGRAYAAGQYKQR